MTASDELHRLLADDVQKSAAARPIWPALCSSRTINRQTVMPKNYQQTLTEILRAMCAGETEPIALMATISCHLYQQIDGFDWVGFYRVVDQGLLKIGPYQGGHGCLVIPFDRGLRGGGASETNPAY